MKLRSDRSLWLILFLLILASIAEPVSAFKTDRTGLMYKPNGDVHTHILSTALSPLGFQEASVKLIGDGAALQDDVNSERFKSMPQNHFDDRKITEGWNYFKRMRDRGISSAKFCYSIDADRREALQFFGEGYHAIQDFYTHSNYLEKHLFEDKDLIIPPDPEAFFSKPPRWLKTGFFTLTEFQACIQVELEQARKTVVGRVVDLHPALSQTGMAALELGKIEAERRWGPIPPGKDWNELRPHLVENAQAHARLPFHTHEEFMRRLSTARDHYYTALNYVLPDKSTGQDWDCLHMELNKDWPTELQGGVVVQDPTFTKYNGQTFFQLAHQLAVDETARQWKDIETIIWQKYDGCANLILPSLKGNVLPGIILNLSVNRLYAPTRTKPIEGSVSVRIANMMQDPQKPIKVRLKLYLERTDQPESGANSAQEKILEFKTGAEQKLDLKPFGLLIGHKPGEYNIVALAEYECDPNFKPVTRRVKLGGGKIEIINAVADPNPGYVGENIKLLVDCNYNEASKQVLHGDGYIEIIDGSYKHTFTKQDLRGDGTGLNTKYKESWIPPQPGKYRWYPRIFSDRNEEARSTIEIDILGKEPKNITSKSSIDKTEGQVDEEFKLTVDYEITGVDRNAEVTPKEWAGVQQYDSVNTDLGAGNPKLKSDGGPIKHQRVFRFQARKPGVYEWTYRISLPGYGEATGSQRFVVKPAKRLVIDEESVTPITASSGTRFKFHVKYHVLGLGGTESLGIVTESAVSSGPTGVSFPSRTETVKGADSIRNLDQSYTGMTPGDYAWSYTIDAGPYGKTSGTLPFKVEGKEKGLRDIELLGARVAPAKGPVGTAFVLTVRYKLNEVTTGEHVNVEENDYVNFGAKTETHETVSKIASDKASTFVKLARFDSTQSGRHVWNFRIDAPGYRSLYGSVPYEVTELEQAPRMRARLDYSKIVLAPGETKNCSIHISGYRGNTADRVELVYPQIMDGWGSLPGQIQVFPGNTSMDPWSMRGAGDYIREYASGQGYRARETAPCGVTAVKIIVRQKGAGEVALTLLVEVVAKGQNTQGKDKPVGSAGSGQAGSAGSGQDGSAGSGQEGNAGSGQEGSAGSGQDGNAASGQEGNAGSGQEGNAGSGQDGSAGSGQDGSAGSGQAGSAGSGQEGNAGSGQEGSAGSGQEGSAGSGQEGSAGSGQEGRAGSGQEGNAASGQEGNAGSGQDGSAGSGTGMTAQDASSKVVYHFKRATISNTAVAGITYAGYSAQADSGPQFTEFTSTSVSVPVAWEESKQGKAGTAQLTARGTVTFTFPDKLFLNSYQTDPTLFTGNASIKCKANATFTLSGPSHAFDSMVGLFVDDLEAPGVVRSNAKLQHSKRMYAGGGATSCALSWEPYPIVSERAQFSDGETAHQPRLLLRNLGRTFVGIGGSENNGFTARVLAPFELEYVAEPGTKTSKEDTDDTVKSGQIIAKLEKSKIILEAGKLPGVSNNILVQNWKRDTAEPIEVSYPGLGPGNMLPNNIRAVYAGGTQLPDALARLQTDNGIYRWPQSYEALKGANPGTYRIPITVKQKGAAAIYLELEVQIVPSTNAKFGNSTALFNKNVHDGQIQDAKPVNTGWNPAGKPAEHAPVVIDDPKLATKPVNTGWNPSSKPAEHAPVVIDDPKPASSPANPGWDHPAVKAHEPPVRIQTNAASTASTPAIASTITHTPSTPAPPGLDLAGRWYGGNGGVIAAQAGNTVVLSTEDHEYATEWRGVMEGNTIRGTWSCPRTNQKGTFTFTHNPNYNQLNMERISGTYYIEDKWGKDPRDFYADRKIGKAPSKSGNTPIGATSAPSSLGQASSPSALPQPAKTGRLADLTGTVWKVTYRYKNGTTEDVYIKIVSGAVGQTMVAAPLTDKNLTQMMGTYDGRTASLRGTLYGFQHLMYVEFSSDYRSGTGRSHYGNQDVLGLTLTRIR